MIRVCFTQIIDRHDGQIWLESEPGQSTAVRFSLSEQPRTGA